MVSIGLWKYDRLTNRVRLIQDIQLLMKDLSWYGVQKDVLRKSMNGVVIEDTTPTSITYRKSRSKPVTLDKPSEEELYLFLYGSMVIEGYTIVPSPDGQVHLCGGGTATYSVTSVSCTCAAMTYCGTPCKHMNMLRGYEAYRLRAMALRSTALEPVT